MGETGQVELPRDGCFQGSPPGKAQPNSTHHLAKEVSSIIHGFITNHPKPSILHGSLGISGCIHAGARLGWDFQDGLSLFKIHFFFNLVVLGLNHGTQDC